MAFGLDKGDGPVTSSGGKDIKKFSELLAPMVFSPNSSFGKWKVQDQGHAISTRMKLCVDFIRYVSPSHIICSMKKQFAADTELLGKTGAGLVEEDREGEFTGDLKNIWGASLLGITHLRMNQHARADKIARLNPWYKRMSVLMRRSPSLKTAAVANSQSAAKTRGIRGMKVRTRLVCAHTILNLCRILLTTCRIWRMATTTLTLTPSRCLRPWAARVTRVRPRHPARTLPLKPSFAACRMTWRGSRYRVRVSAAALARAVVLARARAASLHRVHPRASAAALARVAVLARARAPSRLPVHPRARGSSRHLVLARARALARARPRSLARSRRPALFSLSLSWHLFPFGRSGVVSGPISRRR